jgi:hypothetical protein
VRTEADSSSTQLLALPVPHVEGSYQLEITLIQEGCFWFSDSPLNQALRKSVQVVRSAWWMPYDAAPVEQKGPLSAENVSELRHAAPLVSRNIWQKLVSRYMKIERPRLFEFGLGASTLHHIRNLHAIGGGEFAGVEDDAAWFERLCSALPQLACELGETVHITSAATQPGRVDCRIGNVGVRLALAASPAGDASESAYLNELDREFDVIMVDGKARNEAIGRAFDLGYLRRRHSLLFLHDAGRGTGGYLAQPRLFGDSDYRPSVARMLNTGGELVDGANGHRLEACFVVPRRLSVGAYSLCYREASLLAANIRWMYELVDQFNVVIGPSDQGPGFTQPEDLDSLEILKAVPDPANKIRVVASGSWKNKEDMTRVATGDLSTDVLLQLDADEFWPRYTFELAMRHLECGFDRVEPPHYSFFGDLDHVGASVEADGREDLFYFAPARLLRVYKGATARHFGPAYVCNGVVIGDRAVRLSESAPLWHFAWIGRERICRKIRFYKEARGLNMPTVDEIYQSLAAPCGRVFPLGPLRIRPRPFSGVPMPLELRVSVEKILLDPVA